MLSTAYEIFESFLDGIRKSKTNIVHPTIFVRVWNQWAMMEWVAENIGEDEGIDLTQKQIDDLAHLRRIVVFEPISTNVYLKPNGSSVNGTAYFNVSYIGSPLQETLALGVPIPDNDPIDDPNPGNPLPDEIYHPPAYQRAAAIKFMLNYSTATDQECGLSGYSEFLMSTPMKSDSEGVMMKSFYRKPSDSRLYHRILGNNIVMVKSPGGANSVRMLLDYIKRPNEMEFLDDEFKYTIDLPSEQLQEILEIAIRTFLERNTDPRYKSFLQEMAIARQSNI